MSFIKNLLACCLSVCLVSTHAADIIDTVEFQPPIVSKVAPAKIRGWNVDSTIVRMRAAFFESIVPTFDGESTLLASWDPQEEGVFDRPTVILLHGGHGIGPSGFEKARWFRTVMKANVLILDSYWSRGLEENWKSYTKYGANMRVIDSIAAARFTKSQGADPKKTFLVGESQGGWTVLRAFTKGHSLESEVNELFAGGISYYPNCIQKRYLFGYSNKYLPNLGGTYTAPVLVMTGTDDSATPLRECDVDRVMKPAYKWISFEGATHGWDVPTNGRGDPYVDGKCSNAANVYTHFPMCYNKTFTEVGLDESIKMIESVLDGSLTLNSR